MDMAAILRVSSSTDRKPGRKPARDLPAERERRIQALADRYLRRLTVVEVSRLRGVCERTARSWIAEAREYDDPVVHAILRASRR